MFALLRIVLLLLGLMFAAMFGRLGFRILICVLVVSLVSFLVFGGWRIMADHLFSAGQAGSPRENKGSHCLSSRRPGIAAVSRSSVVILTFRYL